MKKTPFKILLSLFAFALSIALAGGCATQPATTTGTYGSNTYSGTYTAPYWAPTSENVSQTRYYYLPDYSAFYDAATNQYYSMNNGVWTASTSVPASLANTDLRNAFVVMLGPNATNSWTNYSYYQTNYPSYYYQAYPGIVSGHNLITNMPQGYAAVPRAYNESTDQVIFLGEPNGTYTSGAVAYNVPMGTIGTYMPSGSLYYNYGAGQHHR